MTHLATESLVEPDFVGFIFTVVSYSSLIPHENPTIVGFTDSQPHLIIQEISPMIVCNNGNMAISMHADQTPHQQKDQDPRNHSQRQLMHLEVTEETYKGDEQMELTPVSSASSHDSTNSADGLQDCHPPTPPESTTEAGTSSPTSSNDLHINVQAATHMQDSNQPRQSTCDQNLNIANEHCPSPTVSDHPKIQAERPLLGQPWIDKPAQQQELSARNEALVEHNNKEEVSNIESNGSNCDITETEANGQAPEDNTIALLKHINRNPEKKKNPATRNADKKKFKKYYEPKLWCLGPYYSKRKELKEEKAECECHFDCLLKKDPNRLETIKLAQTEARNFYTENLRMNFTCTRRLFFEAFFLMELLLNWNNPDHEFKYRYSEAKSDLLVLDNQIPFFILKIVHGWISSEINVSKPIPSLNHLVRGCLLDQRENYRPPIAPVGTERRGLVQALTMWNSCARTVRAVEEQNREHRITIQEQNYPAIANVENNGVPDHLLGLFYRKYTENWKVTEGIAHTVCDRGRKPTRFPCAKELKERKVKFGVKHTNNLLDISFKGGKLEVPFIIVNKGFITLLANLVLYEKLKGGEKPITSLALFLRCLINTEADIRLLHEAGIMENEPCNDEELPRIIRHICGTGDPLEQYQSHQLSGIFYDLDQFSRDKKNKWYYACYRECCYNPVSVTKLIYGTIVFILILFGGAVAVYNIRSKKSH